jgi:hypothetical protein
VHQMNTRSTKFESDIGRVETPSPGSMPTMDSSGSVVILQSLGYNQKLADGFCNMRSSLHGLLMRALSAPFG